MTRRAMVLLLLAAVFGTVGATGSPASAAGPVGGSSAEIFATNNTTVITDPNDARLRDRLTEFATEVRGLIRSGGAKPGDSTLLDGVFWSTERQKITYERSRRFEVKRTSQQGLHYTAGLIRKRYDQEAVLTFERLAKGSPRVDAFEVEIPGLGVQKFRDGLLADLAVRDRLFGGSVTVSGGKLVLVAELADLALVRRFVANLGGQWSDKTIRYGDREFVTA